MQPAPDVDSRPSIRRINCATEVPGDEIDGLQGTCASVCSVRNTKYETKAYGKVVVDSNV